MFLATESAKSISIYSKYIHYTHQNTDLNILSIEENLTLNPSGDFIFRSNNIAVSLHFVFGPFPCLCLPGILIWFPSLSNYSGTGFCGNPTFLN